VEVVRVRAGREEESRGLGWSHPLWRWSVTRWFLSASHSSNVRCLGKQREEEGRRAIV
jgi:hypothetical protein